jgi:hypothetical protein
LARSATFVPVAPTVGVAVAVTDRAPGGDVVPAEITTVTVEDAFFKVESVTVTVKVVV